MPFKQWSLPLKNCPPEIVEIPQSKRRRIQKDLGVQSLQNEIAKIKAENKMLKEHQKELFGNLLNIEMERNMLKEEVQALYMKKNQVSSLICILEIIMAGVEKYGSKLAKKRIIAAVRERTPDGVLHDFRTVLTSTPEISDTVIPTT